MIAKFTSFEIYYAVFIEIDMHNMQRQVGYGRRERFVARTTKETIEEYHLDQRFPNWEAQTSLRGGANISQD